MDIIQVLIYTLDLVAVEVVERFADFGNADHITPLAVTYECSIFCIGKA